MEEKMKILKNKQFGIGYVLFLVVLLFISVVPTVDAAVTSVRLVDSNLSTFNLSYDSATQSYADLSLTNDNAFAEICADAPGDILDKYVEYVYRDGSAEVDTSILPIQITNITASNCSIVDIDFSRAYALYPGLPSLSFSNTTGMTSNTYENLNKTTGWLIGNFTVSYVDQGATVLASVTSAHDDQGNNITVNYNKLVLAIRDSTNSTIDAAVTNLGNGVVLTKPAGVFTFAVNRLPTSATKVVVLPAAVGGRGAYGYPVSPVPAPAPMPVVPVPSPPLLPKIPENKSLWIHDIRVRGVLVMRDHVLMENMSLRPDEVYLIDVDVENRFEEPLAGVILGIDVPAYAEIEQIVPPMVDSIQPKKSERFLVRMRTRKLLRPFDAKFTATSSEDAIDSVIVPFVTEEKLISIRMPGVPPFLFLLLALLLMYLLLKLLSLNDRLQDLFGSIMETLFGALYADEKSLRTLIKRDRAKMFRRVHVLEDVYDKYKNFARLKAVKPENVDLPEITKISRTYSLSLGLATLVHNASQKENVKFLTHDKEKLTTDEFKAEFSQFKVMHPLEFLKQKVEEIEHKVEEEAKQVEEKVKTEKKAVAKEIKEGAAELEEELEGFDWNLLNFIRKMKAEGKPRAAIRKKLIQVGWNEKKVDSHIEEVFRKI